MSGALVYKGMILAHNLGVYYPDLRDPRLESALALVHQRFSTNTFPSWALAHPRSEPRSWHRRAREQLREGGSTL